MSKLDVIKNYLHPVNKYDPQWDNLDSFEQRHYMEWAIREIEFLQKKPKMGLLKTCIMAPVYFVVIPISLYLSFFPVTFPMTIILWGMYLIFGLL